MDTLITKIWGKTYAVRSMHWDIPTASVQIRMGDDGPWTEYGEASDHRKSPHLALRKFIEEGAIIDADASDEIDAAMVAATP